MKFNLPSVVLFLICSNIQAQEMVVTCTQNTSPTHVIILRLNLLLQKAIISHRKINDEKEFTVEISSHSHSSSQVRINSRKENSSNNIIEFSGYSSTTDMVTNYASFSLNLMADANGNYAVTKLDMQTGNQEQEDSIKTLNIKPENMYCSITDSSFDGIKLFR